MSEWDNQQQGRKYEGYAFTFCKAAFLVLIFQKYALLALSGLATVFYILAALKGVKTWRCWAKPPWVTLFWAVVFAWQFWALFILPPAHATRSVSFHSAAQRPTGVTLIAAHWQEASGRQAEPQRDTRETTSPLKSKSERPQSGTGTILVAGGGKTSPELVKAFVEAAGGADSPIVILPQTEANPLAGGRESVALFRENGARQVDAPVGLISAELCRRLREARGVWIPGGDQNRFTATFPEASGVPEAIREVFRRGGIVGGTSAGASLMGEKMPTGATVETQGLQSGGCPIANGLNLLPKTIVYQHFFARNRMQRLLTAVLDQPGYKGLGVDESGWALIHRGALRAQHQQTLLIQPASGVRKAENYLGASKIEFRLLLPGEQTRF